MSTNPLYPVFFKMNNFRTLVVGGGNVALEKLSFLLRSSPNARVSVVAPEVIPDLVELCAIHNIPVYNEYFSENHLNGVQLLIVGTDNKALNHQIYALAKSRNILVNVADTPELCDFFLGSIVTKGDLKIAISTNGKSPTFAKRFREMLEESLPDSIPELIDSMAAFRGKLKGNFTDKVIKMNKLTKELLGKE